MFRASIAHEREYSSLSTLCVGGLSIATCMDHLSPLRRPRIFIPARSMCAPFVFPPSAHRKTRLWMPMITTVGSARDETSTCYLSSRPNRFLFWSMTVVHHNGKKKTDGKSYSIFSLSVKKFPTGRFFSVKTIVETKHYRCSSYDEIHFISFPIPSIDSSFRLWNIQQILK